MAITAEQERELLNKYHLTTLHPTEWPHQGVDEDESEDSEDEQEVVDGDADSRRANKPNKASSRLQNLGRHASLRSNLSGNQHSTAGVQKDEPDALGRAPSIAAELRRRNLPVEEDITLRNKFMLSSTSFSPALYLSQVHHTASTDDLLRGLDFLSRSIEEKSASLKVLVESNFERFVRAKATIDTVYTEMRTQGVDLGQSPQLPTSTGLKGHTRQPTRGQGHFRNVSGPFGSQSKIAGADKRKNALTKESEYGVQGIRAPLQEVAIKAEEVWGPALGGRERDETLKGVLTALEQHRDIFSLSGAVFESIKKNDYDGVVNAYKSARQYTDKAKRTAATAKQGSVELTDFEVHQIIVTARMWHDVQIQTDVFKREMWKRLKSCHGRSPPAVADDSDKEEHMELIGILMQLGVDENPIWEWINSGYLHHKDRIVRFFERSRIELEINRRRLAARPQPSRHLLAECLRSASATSGSYRSVTDTHREMDGPDVLAFWGKVQSTLSSLLSSSGILGELLEWWEIAQSFIDNKAQKAFPTTVVAAGLEHLELDPDHVENIRAGAVELVTLLRDSVSAFFVDAPVEDLNDLYSPIPPTPVSAGGLGTKRSFTFDPLNVPPPNPIRGEAWEKFAFWPPHSNSLSGSFYLSQIIAVIGTAACEMASMSVIRKQAKQWEPLKLLVGVVRERCIAAICASWNTDAERCKALESWQRSPDRRDLTLMPAYFNAWEDRMLLNAQKIAYISDAVTGKGNGAVDVMIPPSAKLLQAVRGCFITSLYKGLSGMVENAEKGELEDSKDADPDRITVASGALVEEGVMATEAVDITSRNVRMLLTLSNFNHLRNETIPQLISQFESFFSVKLTEESKTVRDVLGQIDAKLFQSFVRPTVDHLTKVITVGIADPAWAPTTSHPTDARPYVYDTLLTLVLVHSEVTSTAGSALTNQVLSYLLEQCSLALIAAFKQRDRYDLPSLMQATLDVEFFAQTLSNYTTDRAGEVQNQVYLTLDERTNNEDRQRLPAELPEMRTVLKKLREGTKGEFMCFRRERRGRSGGGGSR